MKATYLHAAGAIALTFGIAACVSAPAPTPAPPPAVPPAVRPAPTPVPPPVAQEPRYDNFLDAPQTAGTWRYEPGAAGTLAVFVGSNGAGEFIVSCDRPGGEIGLWRAGTSANPRAMRIQTETASRTLQVMQAEDTNPYLTTTIGARDPLLDAVALSKGRFAVEVEGERTLYLPAWVEVSRVIEDCR